MFLIHPCMRPRIMAVSYGKLRSLLLILMMLRSMKRAARGHPLSILDELRNKRISKIRSPVERCFSVMKIVFKAGHVVVTTVERAAVKMTFNAIGYNLFNLLRLVNRNAA